MLLLLLLLSVDFETQPRVFNDNVVLLLLHSDDGLFELFVGSFDLIDFGESR